MRLSCFFVASAVAAFAICALNIAPSFGQARDPQPVTSPVPTGVGIPKITPDAAPSPEELGIAIGSFHLFPTLDLRAGYDTNVYALPAGQQVSSPYFAARPTFDLRSDWSNHMLNLTAGGVFGFYSNASAQNYQNFQVAADGRVDIQRDMYVAARAGFYRTTEALGTPDTAFAATPTVVNSIPVGIDFYQRFNRLFYQVSGGLTRYRYQDYSALSSTVLPGDNRDRTEFGETLRVGYEFFDGVDFWVQGGLNQRRYVDQINAVNQLRDSNGWGTTAGATVDLGGVSKLEGFVGYTQQNYYTSAAPIVGAMTFGLAGYWNGYQPLVVRPFVIRGINETAFTQYQSYVSTTIGAEAVYAIANDWTLNSGASFAIADYQIAPNTPNVSPRTDNFYRASLGLLYSVRPQIQIGPLYEFAAGTGDNAQSPNYTRHIIMLRLVAKR